MSSEPPQGSPGPGEPHAPEVTREPARESDAISEAAGRPAQPRSGNFFATNESFFVSWGRAIVLGIRDTAEEMLEEGRKGAREAFDEGWERFDAKTRYRNARTVTPARRTRKN